MPRMFSSVAFLGMTLFLTAAPAALLAAGAAPDGYVGGLSGVDKAIDNAFFTATGNLYLSVDGGGSLNATYNVQVDKPNGAATVRRAFLLAASTGFTNHTIADGEIRLANTNVVWNDVVPSRISSWNHLADVTTLVRSIIDPAPAGRRTLTVRENSSTLVDGVALAVVFDDPQQDAESTVTLLFGAQDPDGDAFSIALAQPIDPSSPSAVLDMGLGISFGAQAPGALGIQFSTIDVNGARLTSSAGGEDDGATADGALITVGGLDDSNANPANPNAGPGTNPRTDDELYSLLPFITAATTNITVSTQNPSDDDNIFFAYFQISGEAIVTVGECEPSATVLCIDDLPDDRRFKVEVSYSTVLGGGLSGDAEAIPLSPVGVDRGGIFTFFAADNPELLIKVLNGCGDNGHFWIFYSAGTNAGFRLTVTDTATGRTFVRTNPDLTLAPPFADIMALPCT